MRDRREHDEEDVRLDGGNKSLGSYVVLVTQVTTSFHLSLLGSFILSLRLISSGSAVNGGPKAPEGTEETR